MNWKITEDVVVRSHVRDDLQNGLLQDGDLIEVCGEISLVFTAPNLKRKDLVVNGKAVAVTTTGLADGYLDFKYKYIGRLVKD
jgi:hypothetical protein